MRAAVFLAVAALGLAACDPAKAPEPVPTPPANYVPPDDGPCGDGSNPKYPEHCR